MPNLIGVLSLTTGILFIIISLNIGSLIISKYLKNSKLRKSLYFTIMLLLLYIIARLYVYYYSNGVEASGLSQNLIDEKLLFARMFSPILFAIAVTILLIITYSFFEQIRNRSIKFP